MKNTFKNYTVKLTLFVLVVYMLMYMNKGDIQYIYANF